MFPSGMWNSQMLFVDLIAIFTLTSMVTNVMPYSVGRQRRIEENQPVAYKCVLNVFKREKVLEANKKACEFINEGSQTFPPYRFPKNFRPEKPNQFLIKSNTYYLHPLLKSGELFEGCWLLPLRYYGFFVLFFSFMSDESS